MPCLSPYIGAYRTDYPSVLVGATSAYAYNVYAIDLYTALATTMTGMPAQVTAPLTITDLGSDVSQHIGSRLAVSTTFAATSSAAAGRYPITLNASTGGTAMIPSTISLDVLSATLTISPSGTLPTVSSSATLAYTLTFSGPGGTGPLTPSCSIDGTPTGIAVSVNPATLPAAGGTATATISVTPGTVTNYQTIRCNGSGTGVYIRAVADQFHVI